jgi:hypothetical protein
LSPRRQAVGQGSPDLKLNRAYSMWRGCKASTHLWLRPPEHREQKKPYSYSWSAALRPQPPNLHHQTPYRDFAQIVLLLDLELLNRPPTPSTPSRRGRWRRRGDGSQRGTLERKEIEDKGEGISNGASNTDEPIQICLRSLFTRPNVINRTARSILSAGTTF